MDNKNDDLAVLNPPVIKAMIGGREIVCREYGFIEELDLRKYSQPFINDLTDVLLGEDFTLRVTDALFGKHADAIKQLLMVSAEVDEEFLGSLTINDGSKLIDMWWAANGSFFIRCATDYASSSLRARLMKMQKAGGQISTQPLSPTGTTPQESADTPIDK